MVELKDKFKILELIGEKGVLNIVARKEEEDGSIITQYEKNGYTFAVKI